MKPSILRRDRGITIRCTRSRGPRGFFCLQVDRRGPVIVAVITLRVIMNVLALQFNFYPYELEGKPQEKPMRQTDFLVDGRGLGAVFAIEEERPWFGHTFFDNIGPPDSAMVSELLGLRTVSRGLADNHFPLYQCHCGDVQCGVISCAIEREGDAVSWIDIRYDDDYAPQDPVELLQHVEPISKFTFRASQYETAVLEHIDIMKRRDA